MVFENGCFVLDTGDVDGMSSSFFSSSFVNRHKLAWPVDKEVDQEVVEEIDFDHVSEVSIIRNQLRSLF